MDLQLTGAQRGDFRDALVESYSLDELKQMLSIRLGKKLAAISLAPDLETIAFDVIGKSERFGWTSDLLRASIEGNPRSPALLALLRDLGFGEVPAVERPNLEKVVAPGSTFEDVEPFLARFSERSACVCSIIVPGGGGTGFLVGKDLVLTNHHVVAAMIGGPGTQARCIFDFKKLKDGLVINPGRKVSLHATWEVASRPPDSEDRLSNGAAPKPENLDYAVIRLAEPVGAQPVGINGANDPGGTARGWLSLGHDKPSLKPDDAVVLLQHPLLDGRATQEPIQLSIGSVLECPRGPARLWHNARTLGGSSGSPCFSSSLDEVVALHHSGDPEPGKPAWNEAIPIKSVVDDLAQQPGVPRFWTEASNT